jgi:thymidylate synthase (FAD)
MKVRLIGYTKACNELENMDSLNDMIAYCARVSNPSNQYNTATSDKLIAYLAKHKHWSPFEMAHATIEIETTRDIARQILRHRSFAFQEFSQRYSDPTKDLTFEFREARLQDSKNRQNSIELDLSNSEYQELNRIWLEKQQAVIAAAKDAYTWAVSNGIAKEQARAVLPEGNTASRMYMSGSIRSFIHYIDVRTEEGTQKEHRLIAKAVAEAINTIFNITQYVRS